MRRRYLKWILWMRQYDPESLKRWEKVKDKIDSTERLRYVIRLEAEENDPIPFPNPADHTQALVAYPLNFPQDYVKNWRDTQKRLAYVESVFTSPPSLFSRATVEAILRGEQTPETEALKQKVADAEKSIDDETAKLKRKADRMLKQFS